MDSMDTWLKQVVYSITPNSWVSSWKWCVFVKRKAGVAQWCDFCLVLLRIWVTNLNAKWEVGTTRWGRLFHDFFSYFSHQRRPIFDQKWPHLHSHWTPENQDMKWSRNLASRIVRGDRLGWLLPSQVVFWVMKIHKHDGTRHWEKYVFTYYAHLFLGGERERERETSLIFSQIIGQSVDS